jgi:hypothetical protein
VIRHDAIAEDTPGLAVKAADFGGDEVSVFRIGEYPGRRPISAVMRSACFGSANTRRRESVQAVRRPVAPGWA